MKAAKRAVSRMPAMPTTRLRLNRDTALATWHIASSGFDTTTRIASGECRTASFVTAVTIASFVVTRSSRLMPQRALSGGDHDDLRAGGLLVAVRARDGRLVTQHRGRLVQVERLALRIVGDDVDEHHVGVVAACDLLRARRATFPAPTTVTFFRMLLAFVAFSRAV